MGKDKSFQWIINVTAVIFFILFFYIFLYLRWSIIYYKIMFSFTQPVEPSGQSIVLI